MFSGDSTNRCPVFRPLRFSLEERTDERHQSRCDQHLIDAWSLRKIATNTLLVRMAVTASVIAAKYKHQTDDNHDNNPRPNKKIEAKNSVN